MLCGMAQRVEFPFSFYFFGLKTCVGMTMDWPIDLWLAFRVKYSFRYPSLIKRTAPWIAYFYSFVGIINISGNLAIVFNGYFLGKFKWWEGIRVFFLFAGWLALDYKLAKNYFEYAKLDYENSRLTPYRARAILHSQSLLAKRISATIEIPRSQEHCNE